MRLKAITLLLAMLCLAGAEAEAQKVSTLQPASSPLSGTELFYCVQAGQSRKCTAQQLSTLSAGLAQAANNTDLSGTSSAQGAVIRTGFAKAGDADPLVFVASTNPCSPAGGDGGSQVPTSDGKCWLAVFPSTGADLREWGVVFDAGVTDNTGGLQKAFTWAAANDGTLNAPFATSHAVFASPISATFLTETSSLSLRGAGADQSVLEYTGSGTAITVNYNSTNGKQNTTHWRDFTLCTSKAGGANGIDLVETAAATAGQIATNDFTHVSLRGCDGYGLTDYWTTALNIQAVSYFTFTDLTIDGGSTPLGTGVLINGTTPSLLSFVYNFISANFNFLNVGIQTSQDVQGLTVSGGSNFVNINTAIYVPTGSGTDQVTVANSQFNCLAVCVNTQSGDNLISNNYFILSADNSLGVQVIGLNGVIIKGNMYRNGGSFTGTQGETIESTVITPAIIEGNTYLGLKYSRAYPTAGAYPDIVANNNYVDLTNPFPLVFSGVTVLQDQPLNMVNTVACSAAIEGRQQIIVDSTTAAWGATITGGGTNTVNGLCDGSAWTVMGK